jgi:hypothetical protein
MLTRELRDPRVKGTRALIDVLRQQEKTHFQDIIIGDESRIFIDTTSCSILSSLDDELPTCSRRTFSADKRMLIALLGIKRLVYVRNSWICFSFCEYFFKKWFNDNNNRIPFVTLFHD